MDKYNPDLIFELAAGSLPEEEARAAEASLNAEGRAELAAQRAVLAAIADAPQVAMTDIERAHLHRTVAAGIADTTRELTAAAVAAPRPTPKGRTVLWTRFASAAAVAALFVGVVAVGTQLSSGGDDASNVSADTALLATTVPVGEADLTTTTASVALSAAEGDGAGADSDAGAGTFDDAVEESVAQLATAPPLSRAVNKQDLGELTAWLLEASRQELLDPVEDLASLPCFAVAAEDDDLAISYTFSVEYQSAAGETLAGIAYADSGTPTQDPLIRVYDLATCEPVLANTD